MPASPVKYVLEVYSSGASTAYPVSGAQKLGRLVSDPSRDFTFSYGSMVFQRAIALPYPQGFSNPRTDSTAFEWTLGDDPIIEHSGVREQLVTITGRSGVRERVGQDENGALLFASGKKLFEGLQKFLANFQQEASEKERASGGGESLVMVLRALWEGLDLLVEPIQFSPSRNVKGSRFSWEYQISLRAYGTMKPRPLNVLGTLRQKAESASAFINGATAYVAFANEYAKEATRTTYAFLAPVRAVGTLFNQVESLARTGQGAWQFPADVVEAVLRSANDAASAVRETVDILPYADRIGHRDAFYKAAYVIGEARRQALEFFGHRLAETPGANASLSTLGTAATGGRRDIKAGALVVAYNVQQNDTLKSIADKYGVQPSDIAGLNGMSDNATLNDGSPLGPGTVLLVPSEKGVPIPSASASGLDDVYGVDALQDADGDWVLNGEDPDDIALARGRVLFKQAITNRMRTEQGEHGVFPGYGMLKLIGEPATADTAALTASRARTQLLSDWRVAKVEDVVAEDRGAQFWVEATVIAKSGPGLIVSVPVA